MQCRLRYESILTVSVKIFLFLGLAGGFEALSMSAVVKHPKNIVIIGGGIQGVSVAYHLAKDLSKTASSSNAKIVILESIAPASAASGKGGGFMARSWGDGSPTQRLHEVAFDMYEDMAKTLQCESYRKIPVLSVSPGYTGLEKARKQYSFIPSWLDGKNIGRISALGTGDDTAQITPSEFVHKLINYVSDHVDVVIGTCTGIETDQGHEKGSRKVTAVKYCDTSDPDEIRLLPADCVVVSAGPWSCAAEEWFDGAVKLPMEGIKSTSIVWKKPDDVKSVDGTGLFCGEDNRFGTHCKLPVCCYMIGNVLHAPNVICTTYSQKL
jgi:glycine/D-amino acid oxidase-like deaminating enzyme